MISIPPEGRVTTASSEAPGSVDGSWHASTAGASGWFAVAVFCVAQIVSTVDRGMLALVIDPVRADLGITEMQIALLQGFAFAAFYVTVGIPLGMMADLVNRRRLLIGGVVVWSLATIAGGLAANFGQMFGSRLFVGVGEAVLAPCAVTMIGDLFPPERRGRPMAVYVFGSMIAFGLGSLATGLILRIAPNGAFNAVTVLRGRAPWRIAYILIGASGFVVGALLLFLREPVRRGVVSGARVGRRLSETVTQFAAGRRHLLPLYGALMTFALGITTATGWGAVILTRKYGFTPGGAGSALGTGQIVWATLGAIVAALTVDRVARRAGPPGKALLSAVLALAAIPCSLAQWAGSGGFAAILLSEVMFCSAVYGTTMLSLITEITPVRSRGLAVAFYAFVMTMLGGSIGPIAVAFLTEHVFHTPLAVGQSVAIVGCAAFCVSALLSLQLVRRLRALRVG